MSAIQQTPQFVDSADGVRIAVYEDGNPDGAPVVLPEEGPDEDWMASVPRHPVAGSRSQT